MWKSSAIAAEMSLDKSGSFSLDQITEHPDIAGSYFAKTRE
jgi:hypothetical protein